MMRTGRMFLPEILHPIQVGFLLLLQDVPLSLSGMAGVLGSVGGIISLDSLMRFVE